MRVFVAGGSGVIGRHLVPRLVARGHQVTATTTSAAKRGLLAELGAEPVVMNGFDAAAVHQAVATARPEVIVHQMTALNPVHSGKFQIRNPDKFGALTSRLRIEGTDHLIAAARAAGVEHMVAQGNATWNGIREGGPVKTEADPLDQMADAKSGAVSAAFAHLEREVLAFGGAVLRYGGFYGPGTTEITVEPIRKRQFPLVGDGAGYTSFVHLDDAAHATVLAVEQRATGVFNIVDDEPAPASEWLPYLAACAGAKPPLRIPKWAARILAGRMAVLMMCEGRGFSNAKARRELGWELRYPSWRQGFKEELA